MTRQRRKLRVDRELRNQARKQANERRRFRSDPNRFAQELFNPPTASTPTFDIDAAHRHFVKTNTDKIGRSNLLEALPEWVRPARPSVKFDLTTPDLKQLSGAVHSKGTKCAPGMNSIPCGLQEVPCSSLPLAQNHPTSLERENHPSQLVMRVCSSHSQGNY